MKRKMVKNIAISALCLLAVSLLVSCAAEDGTEITLPERPVLTDDTPVNARIKEMYEQYGVWIRYDFPTGVFTYNWSKHQKFPEYTPADPEWVLEAIDCIQSWVFDTFPREFLTRNLPLNVLLADSLNGDESTLDGHIATNYIALGRIGKQWDEQDKTLLCEAWVSLFTEKMLLSGWEYPAGFAAISREGYNQYFYLPNTDLTTKYALLKSGRAGLHYSDNLSSTTYAQDFGDYVAFILYKTPAEKEEYYRKNSDVRKKEKLVQEYFLRHFGFTLKERDSPTNSSAL